MAFFSRLLMGGGGGGGGGGLREEILVFESWEEGADGR